MRYMCCNYFGFKDAKPRLKNIEEADNKEIEYRSKLSDIRNTIKCVAKWVDIKSEPFVCLVLKPSPQKNRLKKMYTFDMTLCDHIFDIFSTLE